ncbi:MAG: serine/threonine-protein kinase [Bacteroidota bacterium]
MPTASRLVTLVPDALDLPPSERDAFLDRACRLPTGAIDEALRAEAAALIAEAEAALAEDDFRSPVAGIVGELADDERLARHAPPETVGPWRVMGLLGEGGQGVVYRAVRADGAFEREVALKLLRPGGYADARLAARLAEERRVLGRMEHEGIARLYDGGMTEDGQPYLAMELVRGVPLTEYAEAARLGVRERVALLAAVCDAVAYAHRRLVVHRDLKPSNVLVRQEAEGMGHEETSPSLASPPQIKLLDFGVAKLLDDEADSTLTAAGWMTPAYAAPEQVLVSAGAGGEITTATDVYALGILAYEVLAGTRPYETSGLTPAEAERVIVEQTPPLASTAAPADRQRALRGDLDTILGTALAKEPERRYASAEALATDLRRHLDGLPVTARQPTVGYRLGRFVRRHRAAVLGTAAALVVLVGVAGAAFVRVASERDRAETEAAKAEAVNDFVLGILGESSLNESGRDVTVAEALDAAAARADSALIGEPEIEGTVRFHLGSTYMSLSRVTEAERELRLARDLFRQSVGPNHLSTISALETLAFVHFTRGELAEAEALLAEALDAARALGDEGLKAASDLTSNLSTLLQQNGRPEEALALLQESVAIQSQLPDQDPEETVIVQHNMAILLHDLGREEESLALREEALAYLRSVYPPGSYMSAYVVLGYAQQLSEVGRSEDALPYAAEAVEAYRGAASEGATEPYDLLHALAVQAGVLSDAGQHEAALAVIADGRAIARETFTPPSIVFARFTWQEAGIYLNQERWDEAATTAAEAIQMVEEARGPGDTAVGRVYLIQARALLGAGRDREAAEVLLRARAHYVDLYGDDHPTVAEIDALA